MVDQFISNDTIRAALAVSPADLPDQLIAPLGIGDEIEVYLDDWLADWRNILNNPKSIAPPGTPTDPADPFPDGYDPNFYMKVNTRLKLWLKYYAAYLVAGGARTFVLKMLTDGNNRSDRFNFDPQEIEGRMKAKAEQYQDQINELLGITAVKRVYSQFSNVPSTYDPVVG